MMKGLILKDFYVLRKTMLLYLVIELVLLSSAIFNPSMLTFAVLYFLILAMMLPVTALAYDERAGWEKYALSMPVTRKNLVLGKYLLGLILLAFTILMSLLFFCGHGAVTGFSTNGVEGFAMILSLSAAAGCILLSVLMPIMLKLGTEKGRIIMMVMILLPVGAFLILSRMGVLDSMLEEEGSLQQAFNFVQSNPLSGILAVLAFCALIVGISLWISFQVVKHKEY